MQKPAAVAALILIYVLVLSSFQVDAGVLADTQEIVPLWGPYITCTTETATVINWKTEDATPGIVQYASDDLYTSQNSYSGYEVADSVQLHHVKIQGLLPDTLYHYRVWIIDGLEPGVTLQQSLDGADIDSWLAGHGRPAKDHAFNTLGANTFTFAVYGDTSEQTPWFTQMERHKLVADRIAAENDISFFVLVGDFTYDADNVTGWNDFFNAARNLLADTTIYPVMGNHENNSPVYREIFGEPPYYSFDCGRAHLTVLDSNTWANYEAETTWLKENSSTGSAWKFVFYHHPSYTSDTRNYGGWKQTMDYWENIFIADGTNAVFSGHTQVYERYLENGINYFNVGTGGGVMSDLSADKPAGYVSGLAHTYGYALVKVGEQATDVSFLEVALISEDSRSVLDIFPVGTVFETVSLPKQPVSDTISLPPATFMISPASVDITIPRNGSQRFNLYITTDRAVELLVGTENLPFTIKQNIVKIPYSDSPQKIELELLGNKAVTDGVYEGKLTFLPNTDEKVIVGIKIKAAITQISGNNGESASFIEDNLALVITSGVIVLILITFSVIYIIYYHRLKKRKLILKVIDEYEKNR